jgi:outer membrane protein assembly complex protein YaeT
MDEVEEQEALEAPTADQEKPYRILFQGNEALGEGALMAAATDELKDFDRLGQRRADADDAAFQMELAYREEGYHFATVDYSLERLEGKIVVTFEVEEGPRVLVEKVELTGNSTFSTETLLPFFVGARMALLGKGELPFVDSAAAAAVSGIRDFYYAHGYLDASVEKPHTTFSDDRTRVTVAVAIQEGIRYYIAEVEFRGDILVDAQEHLAAARQELLDKPYFNRRKLALKSAVTEIYGDLGYPYVRVEVKDRRAEETGAVELDAFIASGPLVTISEIVVEGNERTRETFIRKRLELEPGDRYSLPKRRKSFRELYQSGLFSKVSLELEDGEKPENPALAVRVEEAPSKEFYVEPGWGSYELLRLGTGFREKNLFGTGRILGVDINGSIKAQGVRPSLTDPWFLDTDITATLPVFYNRREEPSFTREDLGFSLGFTKNLTQRLSATAQYTFRMTTLSDVIEEEEGDDDEYDFASVKGQLTYDTRDDLFFPTQGQRSFFSAERADDSLGGDVTFTRLTVSARIFRKLFQDTVVGARYGSGFTIPGPDETTLPLAERFYNGGENTVRSFRESDLGPKDDGNDPAGGLAFNVMSLELRQRIWGNFVGSAFFDYGNISPNRTRSEQGKPPYDSRSEILSDTLDEYFKEFRPAVGFGLLYLLPIGPARFDFAFNPDQDDDRDEDFFRFHFAVGTAF